MLQVICIGGTVELNVYSTNTSPSAETVLIKIEELIESGEINEEDLRNMIEDLLTRKSKR